MFTYKFDESGYLIKYKARIVIRGNLQLVNEDDTHTAILAFKVFKTLIAIIAKYGLKAIQLNAINVFYNTKLDSLIYTLMPEDFETPSICLLLQRALYRLRSSPLLWLQEFSRLLTSLGLNQIPGQPCLFTDNKGIIVFFYIDDIVILFKDTRKKDSEELITNISSVFEMRHMGELSWFLEVRIIQNRQLGKLWLYQDSYITKLAIESKINTQIRSPPTPLLYKELATYDGKLDPT